MAEKKTRRSFLADVLVRAAGGVVLVFGFGASGCGTATKYGGPVEKYGGPPEEDAGTVVKYGGPAEDAGLPDDAGPTVKYGGPDAGA